VQYNVQGYDELFTWPLSADTCNALFPVLLTAFTLAP